LGDAAFDAQAMVAACSSRGFHWIFTMNQERALDRQQKPRPKVLSLRSGLRASQFASIKLTPGKGKYAAQRRAAACRVGRKRKPRIYYAHQKKLTLYTLGEVQVVFSTTHKPQNGKPVEVQKTLIANDLTLSLQEIVELYDLRWQIELFFKELKSTLGFHQYRFQQFEKVERWVELCLSTFLYLEWYRAKQLANRKLSKQQKRWWHWQRTHGLCVFIRQKTEETEYRRLANYTQTKSGLRRLIAILRAARPLEQRQAA
jgi:transposase